jgi:hypothetical protein
MHVPFNYCSDTHYRADGRHVEQNALYSVSSGTIYARLHRRRIQSFNLPLSKAADSVIRQPCPFLGGGGGGGFIPYDQPLTII